MTQLRRIVLVLTGALFIGATAIAEPGPGGKRDRAAGWLEEFDANDDGKLTQVEVDQVQGQRYKKYDKDANGKLSLSEFQALWLEMSRRQMVRRFQRLDQDGDAIITMDEFTARSRRLVQRKDRNEDGALSYADMRRGYHRRGAAPGAPPRHGPGRDGPPSGR